MRIAIINSYYYPTEPGGAERSVRILAQGLVAAGHQVLLVCLAESYERKTINGVEVVRFPIKNSYLPISTRSPSAFSRLLWHSKDSFNREMANLVVRCIDDWQADVLHSNNLAGISVAVWQQAQRRNIAVVHTARDFYLLCPKTTMMKNGRQCQRVCLDCKCFAVARKRSASCVDRFVAISEFMRGHHIRQHYFEDTDSRVIYNAYRSPSAPTLKTLGESVHVGFIGRLVPTKGIDVLLQAARLLADAGISIHLTVAGTGDSEYVDQLKDLANGLAVTFVGHVEPEVLFDAIDCLAVPSQWHEPMGRVAVEAIAHGVPLVITPMGGLPELVQPAFSETSQTASSQSFSLALNQLIVRMQSEFQTMQQAAYQAAEQFSVTTMVASYVEEYRAAISADPVTTRSCTSESERHVRS